MTQPPPPGPEEPAGPAQPTDPASPPPLRPPFPGQEAAGPPPPYGEQGQPGFPGQGYPGQGYPGQGYPGQGSYPGAPQGFGAPQGQPGLPGAPHGFGAPTGFDPSQGSPVYYQAAPTGGYGVPIFGQQAGYDPLISPDYSGWWRRTMAVLKPGWKSLATLQAIRFAVSLLVVIPQALYLAYLQDQLPKTNQDGTLTTTEFDFTPFFAVLGITAVGLFLTYLVAFAVAIACNHVAVSIAAGLRPQVGQALAMATRRVFPLLGWQLLAWLIIMVGICACILPAIYLAAVFLVLPAVVTFERGNVISRCFTLFHKDLGASISRIATIFGISIGVGIVAAIVGQVIELAFGGAQSLTSGVNANTAPTFSTTLVVGLVAGSIVTGLLSAAGAVLTAPLTLTAYADLRARVERLSTTMLAGEIGLGAAATTPEWGAPPTA